MTRSRRATHRASNGLHSLVFALALGLSACSVPIAAALDETDANLVVVTLEDNGVAASKEPDPQSEGRWRVSVGREDASAAVTVLSRESLPPPNVPGVLEALGKGSLVPSRSSEQARLIAGVAGELERSLRAVDGVLSARVHLAVPPGDPFASEEQRKTPSASVLIRHRGATAPIAAGEVQRLVAGAIPGLDPLRVAVVTTPAPAGNHRPERDLSRFGPISVTRASLTPLRLIVGAVALGNLVLIAFLLFLWSRVRRAEKALGETRAAAEAR